MAKRKAKNSPVYLAPVAFEVTLQRPRSDGTLEAFRMAGTFDANDEGCKKLLAEIHKTRQKLAEHRENEK